MVGTLEGWKVCEWEKEKGKGKRDRREATLGLSSLQGLPLAISLAGSRTCCLFLQAFWYLLPT